MPNARPEPGVGWWIGLTLGLLLFSAFGLAAISGALATRRTNAALDQDGVRVTGVIEKYYSKSSGKGQSRRFQPTVKYFAEGREYLAYADRGTVNPEPPVGSALDVVYLPGRPQVARVVGYEERGWKTAAIVGSFLVVPPLGVLAFLGWRGLFGQGPGQKKNRRKRKRLRRRSM